MRVRVVVVESTLDVFVFVFCFLFFLTSLFPSSVKFLHPHHIQFLYIMQ